MPVVNNPLVTLDYVTQTGVSSPAAETAILTSDVVNPNVIQNPNNPNAPTVIRPVVIEADMNITAGTGTTALVIKCRQGGGTGGTQVGASLTHTLAAGASAQVRCKFRDTSGVPVGPGTSYTITVTQTGNTVAGTVNAIDMEIKQ